MLLQQSCDFERSFPEVDVCIETQITACLAFSKVPAKSCGHPGLDAMGVLKGDARLACVDLSNYAERKAEITQQLMDAATTVGCGLRRLCSWE